jgi:RHS repeat-associated protein
MQEALSAATRTKPAKRQIVLLPDGILDEPLVLGPSEKNLISISDVIAPVIVQARPGAQCIVKQALTFQNLPMLEVRGIRLISSSGGSGLRIVNCKGAVLNSCIIVSGTIVFEGSLDTKCIGNTFDFTKGGSVCWKQSGNGFVRNCIFLGNGASTITFKESEPTLDYNCFFPQPPLNPGAHSLVVDPQLLPGSYALSGTNRLLGAGCPQTIAKWPADINGRYHNTKRPCIGAVTYATEQTIQDLGGAVIQRKICGRTYDYVYDGFLRLVEYIDRQNTTNNATYSYDSEGRRIGMTVGRSRYRFVYDKNNTRIEYVDWDGDGRVDRQRTYWTLDTPEDRLGFVEHTKAGPAFFYYLTDHAGSVLRIVDSDGRCVNQYDYDAYGNIDWRTSFETVENRYRFRGMDWDDHAKHYNTKGRIYIPEWGIYLAPDLKGSHVFVTGNPINRTSKSIE